MLDFPRCLRETRRQLPPRRAVAVLVVLFLSASALAFTTVLPSAARAAPVAPAITGFSDDFTRDSALNSTLWQVNGPVGLDFAAANCPACIVVPLDPTFSGGMRIA